MSNIKTKRLFTAFNLPEETIESIKPISRKLNEKYHGITWVRPEIMHITLHFLGDTNEEDEKKIIKILKANENKYPECNFRIDKIDFFPNEYKPRVIYLNCKQKNSFSAAMLQKDLMDKFVNQGIRVDLKRWHSHIALGRIKIRAHHPIDKSRVNKLIKQPINFSINTYDLIESQLTPEGPVYTIVRKFKISI